MLTNKNFVVHAARVYDNPNCDSDEEFYEDVKRFKYLKRLLNQYASGGPLKTNLILNHIIVIFNVFGDAAVDMLFLKLKGHESRLKPFLVKISRAPDRVSVEGECLDVVAVGMDPKIVAELRSI